MVMHEFQQRNRRSSDKQGALLFQNAGSSIRLEAKRNTTGASDDSESVVQKRVVRKASCCKTWHHAQDVSKMGRIGINLYG